MIAASVIIPAYNAEAFVAQAVRSALQQTERRIEVIVIDDASSDATAEVVSGLAAADPRVRLLRNASNAGPGAARNVGFAAAQGDWIAVLDADDLFEPERIERLLALAGQQDADIVSDNLLLCPEGQTGPPTLLIPPTRLAAPKRMSAAEFIAGDIAKRGTRTAYGFFQPMFRRRFLEANGIRYPEQIRFSEDYLLALQCLMCGASWWITPAAMYKYRIRQGTLTTIQTPADLDRLRRAEEGFLQRLPPAGDRAVARALRRHKATIDRWYYYRLFADAVKAGSFAEAAHMLFGGPDNFRHIVLESLHQAPVIAVKALRGGYTA
jgi:glycosyltransferase involved in cell wall biosynthesis